MHGPGGIPREIVEREGAFWEIKETKHQVFFLPLAFPSFPPFPAFRFSDRPTMPILPSPGEHTVCELNREFCKTLTLWMQCMLLFRLSHNIFYGLFNILILFYAFAVRLQWQVLAMPTPKLLRLTTRYWYECTHAHAYVCVSIYLSIYSPLYWECNDRTGSRTYLVYL